MGPPQPPQPPLRRHHKHKHFHTRALCGSPQRVTSPATGTAHSDALHTPGAPHRGSCLTPTTLTRTRWDGHRNAHRYTRGRGALCAVSGVVLDWRPSEPSAAPRRAPPLRLLATTPSGPSLALTLVLRCPFALRGRPQAALRTYAASLRLFCEKIKANDELATQRGLALPDDATKTLFSVMPSVCECE